MKKLASYGVVLLLALTIFQIGCIASAKAGYIRIDQETAKEMMAREDGHIVVDVRRQDEYDTGHIPGAVLIPNESIGCDSPEALPDYDQIILIYCRSGNRSKQAAEKLASMGYTNIYEFGGIIDWTGDVVTAEEEASVNKTSAILRFSSFSGGGYEYSVKVEDPSVVSFKTEYEFEEHAEELDGASYDFVVSFTGLKAGTTTALVFGHSPIMENENSVYRIFVDEALQVSLTPVRAISTFFVSRTGEINYDSYQITMDSDGSHVLSVNEERELPVGEEDVNALMEIIDVYNVDAWDGFNESRSNVLDGQGFRLDYTLTDGTRVHASGDNAFPEHYFDAMGEIWDVLTRIAVD